MDYLEIEKVIGREIMDSRGNPTVEAEVYLVDGTPLAEELLQVGLLQVNLKLWSFVIMIRTDILEKVLQKQWRTLIPPLTM